MLLHVICWNLYTHLLIVIILHFFHWCQSNQYVLAKSYELLLYQRVPCGSLQNLAWGVSCLIREVKQIKATLYLSAKNVQVLKNTYKWVFWFFLCWAENQRYCFIHLMLLKELHCQKRFYNMDRGMSDQPANQLSAWGLWGPRIPVEEVLRAPIGMGQEPYGQVFLRHGSYWIWNDSVIIKPKQVFIFTLVL